jgi:predicted kinase
MSVTIVMLVGCPGAGKTTLTSARFLRARVVHSDDYKSNERRILKALDNEVDLLRDAGNAGGVMVLDGCHGTAKKRAVFLAYAERKGVRVEAHHLATPFATCMQRCKKRAEDGGRRVPPVALYTYRKRFEKVTYEEGFDKIVEVQFEEGFDDLVKNALKEGFDKVVKVAGE